MTPDDVRAFMAALKPLAVAYREEVTEELALIYFAALSDLPLDGVRAAITASIRTCKFFPRPAELRELARPKREMVLNAAAYRAYLPPPAVRREALPAPVAAGSVLAEALPMLAAPAAPRVIPPVEMTEAERSARLEELRAQAKRIRGEAA